MARKTNFALILLLTTLGISACTEVNQTQTPEDTSSGVVDSIVDNPTDNTSPKLETKNPPAKKNRLKVYFPHPSQSEANLAYVEPVWRTTDSQGVAKFAIEQLIIGPTEQEQKLGLEEALRLKGRSNCGRDFSISISKEVAKLKFCRSVVSAGVGDDVKAQSALEETLKQFSTVKSVVILDKEGNCLGDLSGENRCLGTKQQNSPRLTSQSQLSINGIGPIFVGMTLDEAAKVGKVKFVQVGSGGEEYGCLYFEPEGIDDLAFMVTDGKISRIDVDSRTITTLSGGKIGDSRSRIESLYPGKIEATPHQYLPGGHYLTLVPQETVDSQYRVIFETDANNRVIRFRSGKMPEVRYIEGCA